MPGSKSTYLSKKILNHVLGPVTGPTGSITSFAFTAPATVYVGLWTQTLNDSSDGSSVNTPGEVTRSGSNYGRANVENTATNWPNATEPGDGTALKNNATAITFATASASWGTITHFALLDHGSEISDPQTGNILYWGQLSASKAISTNDTASFAANALSITEN